MLLVLEPVAHVSGSIGVLVRSMTVGLIVEPHAFVDVAISVHQRAKAIGLVVLPLALVSGGVRPDLHSVAMFLPVSALAGVCRTICVCRWPQVDLVVWLDTSVAACSRGKLVLVAVLDFELLPLLVDVSHLVIVVSVFGLDGDFLLSVGTLRAALVCAVAHLITCFTNLSSSEPVSEKIINNFKLIND